MDGGPPANTHRVPLRRHPLRLRIAGLGRKKESAYLDGLWMRCGRGSIPESPETDGFHGAWALSTWTTWKSAQNLKLTWQVARTTIYIDPAFCRAALAADGTRPQPNADRSKTTSSHLPVFPRNWRPEMIQGRALNNSNLLDNRDWQIPGRTCALRPRQPKVSFHWRQSG